nr:arginine--tRNA ligase, cytoplasmic [Tanacetum cinerariifolium]
MREVLGEVFLAPHIMSEYLYELCNKFNDSYSSAWQVDEYAEESKFLLFEATKVVMGKCLDLLGITRIDKI